MISGCHFLDYGIQSRAPRSVDPAQPDQNWVIKPYLEEKRSPSASLQASMWVRLLEAPSPFSDDQALLLCQETEDYWLAWIPDFGETLVHVSQFQLV
jgi:hypothetical protein